MYTHIYIYIYMYASFLRGCIIDTALQYVLICELILSDILNTE